MDSSEKSDGRVVNLQGAAHAASRTRVGAAPPTVQMPHESLNVSFRMADGVVVGFAIPPVKDGPPNSYFWKERALPEEVILSELRMMAIVHDLTLLVGKEYHVRSKYEENLPPIKFQK